MKVKILGKVLLPLVGLAAVASFAGQIEVPPVIPVVAPSWYALVGAGYAWSGKTSMKVNNNIFGNFFWPVTQQGYNGTLDQSPFVELGVGKQVLPWLASQITVGYFNDFKYRRFQSDIPTGVTRIRNFDLTNMNAMLTFLLSYPQFTATFNHVSFSPFIGGGIGPSLNTIRNFNTNVNGGSVTSVGLNNVRNWSVALQGEAGISMQFSQNGIVDLGYRYYYGGRFRGPSQIYITTATPAVITYLPGWKGRVTANTVFADIRLPI